MLAPERRAQRLSAMQSFCLCLCLCLCFGLSLIVYAQPIEESAHCWILQEKEKGWEGMAHILRQKLTDMGVKI